MFDRIFKILVLFLLLMIFSCQIYHIFFKKSNYIQALEKACEVSANTITAALETRTNLSLTDANIKMLIPIEPEESDTL